ncbi:hypothetical protein LDENG_00220370 [Lucifuga dentata]|nr:hypothetical protein LDENG_00220370 [Lucifuga dentata]
MLEKASALQAEPGLDLQLCIRGSADISHYCIAQHILQTLPLELLLALKDHTSHFACLSLIYSIFIHVTLLTIISQSIHTLLEW